MSKQDDVPSTEGNYLLNVNKLFRYSMMRPWMMWPIHHDLYMSVKDQRPVLWITYDVTGKKVGKGDVYRLIQNGRYFGDQRGVDTNVLIASSEYFESEMLEPPKGLLIDVLLPPNDAEEALYNIIGAYERWVEKYGLVQARRLFYMQSARVVSTFWLDWLLKRVKLIEIIRRRSP